MMKKPPGLWLLLSAGVLWLCFQDVSCVRATSLIFGKSTTTTTTTAPGDAANSNSTSTSDVVSEVATVDENVTPTNGTNSTRVFTGVPQIDYLTDPNLPRELNGFNLTDYPFYDRVPEEITFKCDGLHDGFYASVPHKCQVYHHCLFGTRYDFLCANYTAFDQKTFICQFVSEVDCVNSKKFWHRNDALYQAQSTTTIKPLIVYTPPSPPAILTGGGAARRPQNQPGNARRRKPARRRRPQYDYYDEYDEADEEYYDDPRYTATEAAPRGEGRRRNKRPRPRPRPIYDDEYEEEYEERYDRRRGNSRRNRPSSRRNKEDRRKYEDEYEEYEEEDPRLDRSEERRNKKPKDDRRRTPEEDKKPEKRTEDRKRDEKRPSDDRRHDKRKQEEEEDRRPARPTRKGQRKPVEDDYLDDERRPSSKRNKEEPTAPAEDSNIKPLVKPAGGSIFDRPRVAPRIRPPVPKSEADKYAYKTTIGPVPLNPNKGPDDEEYYDEYEEEVIPPPPPSRKRPASKDSQADASIASNSRKTNNRNRDREEPRRNKPKTPPRKPLEDEEYYDEEEERPPRRNQKPKNEERRVGQGSRKRPATVDYEDEDIPVEEEEKIRPRETSKEDKEEKRSPSTSTISSSLRRKYGNDRKEFFRSKQPTSTSTTTTSTTTTTTTTTTTEQPPKKEESSNGNNYKSVRIVKRPFLPSRGGNPYISRGLQPIGLKSESQKVQESRQSSQVSEETSKEEAEEEIVQKPIKQMRNKPHHEVVIEDYRSRNAPNRVGSAKSPKESIVTKPVEKNPLDINENEYDVTLNDALNPTLPNLPLRPFPTGFGNNVNNEYTFGAFHRPRYVVDATINSASSEYQYRYKQPQTPARQEPKTSGHPSQHIQVQVRQPESHQDFQAQYTTNYQQFRPSPRIQHTQAFFAAY